MTPAFSAYDQPQGAVQPWLDPLMLKFKHIMCYLERFFFFSGKISFFLYWFRSCSARARVGKARLCAKTISHFLGQDTAAEPIASVLSPSHKSTRSMRNLFSWCVSPGPLGTGSCIREGPRAAGVTAVKAGGGLGVGRPATNT